jgi:hypothetical protein
MTGKAEANHPIAWSYEKEKLRFDINSSSHDWNKVFAKGSPLEWFNPMLEEATGTPDIYGHGIHDIWLREDEINQLIIEYHIQ